MKKVSCDIIKDILPLYIDDVVSDDTKNMVEEHLQSCEECRKEVLLLGKDIVVPIAVEAQRAEVKVLKRLKKHYKNKKIITVVLSVILAIGILNGIYAALVLPENVIPYDASKIKIEELGDKIYASYYGNDFDGSVGLNPTLMEVDGEKKNVAIFYFYESPWSKLTARFKKEQEKNMEFIGNRDEIDEVYYGKFDSKHLMDFEKLSDLMEETELVWKK